MSDTVHSTHPVQPPVMPKLDPTKKVRGAAASTNYVPESSIESSFSSESEGTVDHNFHDSSHVVNYHHLNDKYEEPHFIDKSNLSHLESTHFSENKKNVSQFQFKKTAVASSVVRNLFTTFGILKLSAIAVATAILSAVFPPFAPVIITIVIVCGLVIFSSFAYLKFTFSDKKLIEEINSQDQVHEDEHIELSSSSTKGVGLGVSSQKLADALTLENSVESTLSRLKTSETKNFTASILKGYNEVVHQREQNLKKLITGIYEISDALTLDQQEKVMSGTSLLHVIDNRGLVAICPPNLTKKLDEINEIDPNLEVSVHKYNYNDSTKITTLSLTIKKKKNGVFVDKIKVNLESEFKRDDAGTAKLTVRSKLNSLMSIGYGIAQDTVISNELFVEFLNDYITLVEEDGVSNSAIFKNLMREAFNRFHKSGIPDLIIPGKEEKSQSIPEKSSVSQDSDMIKLLLANAHPYFAKRLLDVLDLVKIKEMTGVDIAYDSVLSQFQFETQLSPQQIKQNQTTLRARENYIHKIESELKENKNLSPKQSAKLSKELEEEKEKLVRYSSSIGSTSKIEKVNLNEVSKVTVDKFEIIADVII